MSAENIFKDGRGKRIAPTSWSRFKSPEGWKIYNLDENCSIQTGKAFGTDYFNSENEGWPLIKRATVNGTEEEPVYTTEDFDNKYIIEEGDVLVSMDGNFEVKIWSGPPSVLNQRVCKVTPQTNKINTKYLGYVLQPIIKHCEWSTGGTTIPSLSNKQLKNINIPAPPIEEQERIVSLLSDVDAYIEKTRERHTKLTQAKQALAQDIFESEDEWNTVSVSDVCTINPESFTPEDYDEEELPYLSLSCVSDGQLVDIEHVDVQDPRDRATRLVRENDVLVGTVEPKNKSHYRIKKDQDGFVASSGFIVLRSDEDILPEYLEQYVLSRAFFRQMDAFASGSTYPAVSLTNFKKMRISYPSVEEQQEIGEVLSTIDELLKNVQEDISAVREFKQGLLNQMFS